MPKPVRVGELSKAPMSIAIPLILLNPGPRPSKSKGAPSVSKASALMPEFRAREVKPNPCVFTKPPFQRRTCNAGLTFRIVPASNGKQDQLSRTLKALCEL